MPVYTEENTQFKILVLEDEFLLAQDLGNKLTKIGYPVFNIKLNYQEAISVVNRGEIDFAIVDISLNGKKDGIKMGKLLGELDIPYIFLTSFSEDTVLNEARKYRPYGFLIKPISEKELKSTIEIVRYRAAHDNLSRVEKERQFLLEINNSIVHIKDSYAFFARVTSSLRKLFDLDRAPHIALLNEKGTHLTVKMDVDSPEVNEKFLQELDSFNPIPVSEPLKKVINHPEPSILNLKELRNALDNKTAHSLLDRNGIKSAIIIPLRSNQKLLGYFSIMTSKDDVFGTAYFKIFKAAANHISIAVQNILYFEEVNKLRETAELEKKYLNDEINTDYNVDEFIGNSLNISSIKEKIKQVAKVDTSVLIVGETGTGKELIARSIHRHSQNAKKPMVKINCASLPSQLIESELFGHEKGSFTGAERQVIGKFEMANDGILFLDEIGELPLDLQPKLLRVLQEKEIVRIGGTYPIKLNVKILTATNRNLEVEVEKGNFRADLFYRLSVFPILIPPLRERKDEISDLANFFLKKFSRKLGKTDLQFSEGSMANFLAYDWPGNIRELQHVIEREVILSKGQLIDVTQSVLKKDVSQSIKTSVQPQVISELKTFKQAEKELIIRTLEYTEGKVRGPGGAAELLDMNPSTLESRIRKLGIVKRRVFES